MIEIRAGKAYCTLVPLKGDPCMMPEFFTALITVGFAG